MTRIVDLWRAIDPEARMISGSVDALQTAVRGVARSRATAPHLPATLDGELLVADLALAADPAGLDGLIAAMREAGLKPAALALTNGPSATAPDAAGDALPVLLATRSAGEMARGADDYLTRPDDWLAGVATELRLGAAEAALATPEPSAAAGLVASRLRRGVAVAADGELVALHPRPAGRALAARFAALHARLLTDVPARASTRRTPDGLYLLERGIRTGASVWLFDDLPFARIDEVGAEALTITLRALLRRPPTARPMLRLLPPEDAPARAPGSVPGDGSPAEAPEDVLWLTALAVARANGKVATAARELGVHRNTVLYRLRRARHELGVDPRRPQDAVDILLRAQGRRSG